MRHIAACIRYNLRMDFAAAQEFVLSLEHGKMDFDLTRLRRVLDALGVAEPPYPIAIVGGTNGKGSAVVITEAILAPHLRVGSFVKPHIFQLNERARVGGQPIGEGDFTAAVEEVKRYLDRGEDKLTFFEATLAVALLAFRRAQVDIGLIEVGLGGRFDAANVLPRVLTVITGISREHEQFLGRNLSEIAFEKAGIMREGVPVVLSRDIVRQPVDVMDFLVRLASLKRAPVQQLPAHAAHDGGSLSPAVQTFALERRHDAPVRLPERLSLNLLGAYQERNLEVALAMVEALAANRHIPAIEVPPRLTVNYRGRFEPHELGRGLIVFDAAHNPEGCQALAKSLSTYFAPHERFFTLFGCQEGKDVQAMLKALAPWVEALLPLRVEVLHPMSQQTIVEAAHTQAIEVAGEGASLPEQADYLKGVAMEGARVLVCGSCYYLGEVMEALGFGCRASQASEEGS